MPLHVAGLSIFAPPAGDAALDFLTFRSHLSSRLPLVRTYRERLVMVPLGLGNPYWIEDPAFDLDLHLQHVALPKPGGWQELRTLMEHFVSHPLDRTRPLWAMAFVTGLDTIPGAPPGSVALITKVHHAAIDGVAGGVMLAALLDPTPEPEQAPAFVPWRPPPAPATLAVLAQSTGDLRQWPRKLVNLVGATARAALTMPFVPRVAGAGTLPRLYGAPRTRFNAPVSAQRVWDCVAIPLSRVRAVKLLTAGATVNDVLLASAAGALRRYLVEKDDLPAAALVAMVPISIRQDETRRAMGNQVSAILVDLATDEADPVRRLQRIHAGTSQSKAYHQAMNMPRLIDGFQLIPFGIAQIGVQLYTGLRVTGHINPIFNCVITNVPGAQAPLYLYGAPMVANMGLTPIYDGVGLMITIFSYMGMLTLSATSCRGLMPDVDLFLRYVEEALAELENLLAPQSGKTDSEST